MLSSGSAGTYDEDLSNIFNSGSGQFYMADTSALHTFFRGVEFSGGYDLNDWVE
jgi:hypothetical protein